MFGNGNSVSVGVIGLGIIGSRVAECLRRANLDVYVWNRTNKAEPNFLATPYEIAQIARVVQIFVRDSEALLQVMRDMQPALNENHVVLCHSTVSVQSVKEAAAMAREKGASFLDAPFTGSKLAAEKGELVYYIGGEESVLETVRPVLAASSKKILHLGKTGDATVLKITTNLISAAVVEALAEALAITKAHDVSPEKLAEALAFNANGSPLINMKLPNMISRSYNAHFSLKNMLKDARYAQALAVEKNIALPVLNATAQVMEEQVQAGRGELDYSVVMEHFTPIKAHQREHAPKTMPAVAQANAALTPPSLSMVEKTAVPSLPVERFESLLKSGGAVNLSNRAKWEITGADRLRYLNGQVTNDAGKAKADTAVYACVTNAKGKIEGDVFIHPVPGIEALSLDAEPDLHEPLRTRLERYIVADDVTINDVTSDWNLWHFFGASVKIAEAFELPENGRKVKINRLGQEGVDVWLPVSAEVAKLIAEVPVLSEPEMETLRIIAAVPRFPHELNSDVFPPEAGLQERAMDYSKGCYIGQEVLSRIKTTGKMPGVLVRVQMKSADGVMQAGAALSVKDANEQIREVGVITSVTHHPVLDRATGLAYVRQASATAHSLLLASEDPTRIFEEVEISLP
ncbi:hypothetical protein BH11VER1_BH11VER1_16720 [soil metagenome]